MRAIKKARDQGECNDGLSFSFSFYIKIFLFIYMIQDNVRPLSFFILVQQMMVMYE